MENTCIIVTFLFAYFESAFHGELISKEFWPPLSPYPKKRDLFMWEYLRNTFYSVHFHTMEYLQLSIQLTVHGISKETFRKKVDTHISLIALSWVQNTMANTLNRLLHTYFTSKHAFSVGCIYFWKISVVRIRQGIVIWIILVKIQQNSTYPD